MKRALLLAAALLAALALLWLLTRLDAHSSASAPEQTAAAEQVSRATASAHMESEAAAARVEGDLAAGPTRVEQTPETTEAVRTSSGSEVEVIGRVVKMRTGEPVHSGEVVLTFAPPSTDRTLPERLATTLEAPIDKEGRFRFELPVGSQLSQVSASPYPTAAERGARPSEFVPLEFAPRSQRIGEILRPEGKELRIEVEGASELRGIVLDAQTHAPLEGVRISFPNSPIVQEAQSGVDGRFTLSGIPPAQGGMPQKLQVRRRDYLGQSITLGPTELAPDAAPLTVELERGLTVAGRVVDAGNRPLSGVSLHFRALGIESSVDFGASVLTTRSDELGGFRLTTLPPCASLFVELQAQTVNGRDLLPLQRDLGPLRADRSDLQIEVQTCGLLEVRAELADGTQLEPRAFQVLCTGTQPVEAAGSTAEGRLLRAPIGIDLELEAYTTGKDVQDSTVYLRGRQTVRLDGDGTLQLRIVLAQRGRFAEPPSRDGARELVLPGVDYLRSTLDVQLVDARSGNPVRIERYLSVASSGGSLMAQSLEGGWLRVRGPPGKHRLEAEIDGGTHEVLEVVLPVSGYGTVQWRVGAGK